VHPTRPTLIRSQFPDCHEALPRRSPSPGPEGCRPASESTTTTSATQTLDYPSAVGKDLAVQYPRRTRSNRGLALLIVMRKAPRSATIVGHCQRHPTSHQQTWWIRCCRTLNASSILLACATIRATVATEVLMSIRCEQVDHILAGFKGWEFRRRTALQPGSRVWMYATAPTAAVLGWFEVGRVVRVSARSPHRQIAAEGYVTVRELRQYFAGLSHGVAIEVMHPGRLARPVRLPRGESGPQSYRFITDRASDRALLRRLKAGI